MRVVLIIISFLLFIIGNLSAQYGGCVQVNEFLKTTTLVVITGNEKFDSHMKDAMEEYWDVTEFEFIPESEVAFKCQVAKYSFIMPHEYSIAVADATHKYPVIAVMQGGRKTLEDLAFNNLVAYGLLSSYHDELTPEDVSYRVKHVVKQLNRFINLRKQGKITNVCGKQRSSAAEIYNSENAKVKTKTLLFIEGQLGKVDENLIKTYYKHPYKIVDHDFIEQAINEKNSDYAYVIPVYTRNRHVFIFDAETGHILYDDYGHVGAKFRKADIKTLGKVLN